MTDPIDPRANQPRTPTVGRPTAGRALAGFRAARLARPPPHRAARQPSRRPARRRGAAHGDGARHRAGPRAARGAAQDPPAAGAFRVRLHAAVPDRGGQADAGDGDRRRACRARNRWPCCRRTRNPPRSRQPSPRSIIAPRSSIATASRWPSRCPSVALFADPRQMIDPADATRRLKQVLPRSTPPRCSAACPTPACSSSIVERQITPREELAINAAGHSRGGFPPDRGAALSDGPRRLAGAGRRRCRRPRRRRGGEVVRPAG